MTINFIAGSYAETFANLDVSRYEMVEGPMAFSKKSPDITTAQGGRNLVKQWDSTHTWTLQPINLTTDFVESANHEYLKLRLSDFNINGDFFTEYPEGTRKDQNGGLPYDYFLSGVVTAANLPQGYPYGLTQSAGGGGDTSPQPDTSQAFLFANLPQIAIETILTLQNLQQDNTVCMGTSKAIYPYNQGFYIRFWVEGTPSSKRSALLVFYFGEFALRLNTTGTAELQITTDGTNYSLVDTFQWTDAESVHGKHHNILVFPHARNKVEIKSQDVIPNAPTGLFTNGSVWYDMRGMVWEWPGELKYDTDGVTPIITASAPIRLDMSREFKPHIQVSLLGFVNGTATQGSNQAFLYDSIRDMHQFPVMPLVGNVDYDANGCTLSAILGDPTTEQPWLPNTPTNNLCQFACSMVGLGDLNNGLASSKTPELYGYGYYKTAYFQYVARNTVTLPTTSQRIDTGASADAERLTITIDNSAGIYGAGSAQQFEERGNIPLTLVDEVTGLTLFEGTGMSVEAGEAVKPVGAITIEACGMIDKLKRTHFTDNAPNFSYDPSGTNMQGYYWADAVRWCFMVGGFDPYAQVNIENISVYNFRLWDDGGGGGTGGGANNPSSEGHVTSSGTTGPRWKPKFDTTPADFLDSLLVDWLGWHYKWNTIDHSWHVFKRPMPNNPADVPYTNGANAVCSFWGQLTDAVDYDTKGLPVYLHNNARSHATRPQYTTVIAATILNEANTLTRDAFNAAIAAAQAGNSSPIDALIKTSPHVVHCVWDNKAGYPGPNNNPPNTTHPDYLGQQCIRYMPIMASSRDALAIWTRNAGYNLCYGHIHKEFVADWGDATTLSLRKWSQVYYNGRLCYIDTIEPDWSRDGQRKAHYRVSIARTDIPPPR